MKRTYSLKAYLTRLLLIFVVGLLGLIFILQIGMLNGFYRSNKLEEMEAIAASIERGILNNDLNNAMKSVSLNNEACIRIDTYGAALTGYCKNEVCALEYLNDRQVADIYKTTINNGGEYLFEDYQLSQNSVLIKDLYILSRVVNFNGQQLLIMVSSIVRPLKPTIDTIRSQFFGIALMVVVMTVILAYVYSSKINKILNKLKENAMRLPTGDYPIENFETNIKEFNDINETLIESSRLIKQADVARKELLSNVSHDLRTPLTMIVGYGEMMQDFDEEKTNENIEVIVSEAKRLSGLVDDILDVSKGELGKLELHKKDYSVNEIVYSVYHQYSLLAESRNIDFKIDLDADTIVEVDEKRIKQVLYNFVNNAINYNTNEKPEIIISTKISDDRRVLVSVYDNGPGIKKEEIPLIWDRYYKVDAEHKRQVLGSGIGLSLSRMILELHGVEYGVDSKEGEYTRFYFYLKNGE